MNSVNGKRLTVNGPALSAPVYRSLFTVHVLKAS